MINMLTILLMPQTDIAWQFRDYGSVNNRKMVKSSIMRWSREVNIIRSKSRNEQTTKFKVMHALLSDDSDFLKEVRQIHEYVKCEMSGVYII